MLQNFVRDRVAHKFTPIPVVGSLGEFVLCKTLYSFVSCLLFGSKIQPKRQYSKVAGLIFKRVCEKEKARIVGDETGFLKRWRKEGDSNPRYPFEYVSLANWWFQPLTHPSRDGTVVERRFSKRSAKIRRIFESANFFGLFYFANIPYFCRSYINESRSSIDCLWQM